MEILKESSTIPQQASLILGFFDGIHAGHQKVLENTQSKKRIVVTFSSSPAVFFNKNTTSIYPRKTNYKLLEEQGIDYIYEQDFAKIASLSAQEYLEFLVQKFNPVSITTGFNHTFGANRIGTPDFIEKHKNGFEYFCTAPTIIDNEIVSTTKIKEFLSQGELVKAKNFLTRNFTIESTVIEGAKLGRKLGFPTANMEYPKGIIKLPYGVYKTKVMGLPAVLNWGIKPTIGAKEVLEVHIPNFEANLYNQILEIEILSKIRDEQKFENLDELKSQIEKDVIKCLES